MKSKPKYKVGDTIYCKNEALGGLNIRNIIGLDSDHYSVKNISGGNIGLRWSMSIDYGNHRYILYCKKVKDTPISRAFYKGKIKEEKGEYLIVFP